MTTKDFTKFKTSQTYKNLLKAFEGESAARVRYQLFSSQAKKDGLFHVSEVFTAASDNEKEHAEIWFKLIYNGTVPPTKECLEIAEKNEKYEWSSMYKGFAVTAKKEGYEDIAKLFHGVGEVEKFHESRYVELSKDIHSGKNFKDTKIVYWYCLNCGTMVKQKLAPELCPVCSHPKSYFVRKTITIVE